MESYTEEQFYDAIEKGDNVLIDAVLSDVARYQKELGNYNQLVLVGAYDALRHMTKPVEPEFHKRFNSAHEKFHRKQLDISNLVGRIQSCNRRHPERAKMVDELYTKHGKTLEGVYTRDEMINAALAKLKTDAKDYVFQNYPTTSPILRTLLIQNAHSYELSESQVQELKENGDIRKVLRERNVHLAPYGHGQIRYQNESWTLTPPQYADMQKALTDYMPNVMVTSNTKWTAFINNRQSHFPFSNKGMHELENVLKLEECMWEMYLIKIEEDYIRSRQDSVRYNVSKAANDGMRIEKHGLTGLF